MRRQRLPERRIAASPCTAGATPAEVRHARRVQLLAGVRPAVAAGGKGIKVCGQSGVPPSHHQIHQPLTDPQVTVALDNLELIPEVALRRRGTLVGPVVVRRHGDPLIRFGQRARVRGGAIRFRDMQVVARLQQVRELQPLGLAAAVHQVVGARAVARRPVEGFDRFVQHCLQRRVYRQLIVIVRRRMVYGIDGLRVGNVAPQVGCCADHVRFHDLRDPEIDAVGNGRGQRLLLDVAQVGQSAPGVEAIE